MKKIILLLLALTSLGIYSFSQSITITVDGVKQGKFKGESLKAKFQDRIELTGYAHEVAAPRDVATGMAAGKRNHQPIVIQKFTGASSPQFLQALTGNEILKTVVIDFYKPDMSTGQEVNYYTVTLSNALVSSFNQVAGTLNNIKITHNNLLMDEIKLTFQKIVIEDKLGKTMSQDDSNIK